MSECGTTCLAMIFKYHGLYNIQAPLRDLAHVSAEGTDLYTLSEIAKSFGFNSDGYQLSYEHLHEISLPCIAHYEGNHFVVITGVNQTHISLADPAFGKDKLTKDEFGKKWNGIILTLEPTEQVFKNPDVMDLIEAYRAKEKDILKSFYLSLLFPFRRVLVEILVASFVLQILGLALPFFTQSIIDRVLVYQDKQLLFAILAGMVCIFIVQSTLTYTRNILLTQFKVRFELEFFSGFFEHFIHLTQPYFDGHKREDFINRFQENIRIRNILSPSILQSFLDVLFVVNALVVLFFYNGGLALIATGFIAFFATMTILYSPELRRLEDKIFYENIKTMGGFLDTLLGMQTVKLLSLEKLKFWEWKNQYKKALNKVLMTQELYVRLQSLLQGAYFLSQISVYWVGAYMAFTGGLTIGAYIAFISIFSVAMASVNQLSVLWFMVTELSITYSRLNDVFRQPPEVTDLFTQQTHIRSGSLTLDNVSFRYSANADKDVLSNLSISISAGERVAIVGRNGSGKTTLAKLLVKFYTDYSGKILIGETDLRNLHPHYLRRKVVLLPQDVYVFSGTIRENILYANPAATMDEVVEATDAAGLHDYVRSLYLGYNHKVGEGGSNLSGGQKLKLAFARLFLQNPEIIILDEASSALDVEAEQLIMQNLYARFRGKTILSIAHRLHTVRNADRIVVMDGGKIAEQGTHTSLLLNRGLYYQFTQTYLDF